MPSLEVNQIKDLSEKWLNLDKDPVTRKRISDLVEKEKWDNLESLLQHPLKFGTAGLRAEMDAGFSRLNDLTIIQATQGVCVHLCKSVKNAKERGVIIGWDHRFNSKKFSKRAASVLVHYGVKVWLYQDLVHTPLVPFAIEYLNAAAGIMITASHNPKNDNGYKLYWENACQVIEPIDSHIQSQIELNSDPWTWDISTIETSKLCKTPPPELIDEYFREISSMALFEGRPTNHHFSGIVYTPMHGVGLKYAERAFRVFELPAFAQVDEQALPDPEFPTVKYPNPEEGKGALELAFKKADYLSAQVVLANDPDADRLAVAEKRKKDGKWVILSGNQIGYLFADYLWQNRDRSKDRKYAMLASTVSSKLLKKMAQIEGFRFEETLSGFKWLGNASKNLQQQNYQVLMAYEEAIGFMIGNVVADKDGISALAVMGEMAAKLHGQGSSLINKLENIYKKYGYFTANNSYYVCRDKLKIQKIFEKIRYGFETGNSVSPEPKYPSVIGDRYKVTSVRDLTIGYDSTTPDKKPTLPVSKSTEMITFTIEDLIRENVTATFTLRTSGTEPKIKYYSEMSCHYEEKTESNKMLKDMVNCLLENLLEPVRNGLIGKQAF